MRRTVQRIAVGLALALTTTAAFAVWRTAQVGGNTIAVVNGNPSSPGTTVIAVGNSGDGKAVRAAEALAKDLNKAAEKGPKR